MPQSPNDETDVLTPEDVEREFKLRVGTQASMRSRGQLPYFKLGGGRIIRYRRRELVEWMQSKLVPVRVSGSAA